MSHLNRLFTIFTSVMFSDRTHKRELASQVRVVKKVKRYQDPHQSRGEKQRRLRQRAKGMLRF